MTAAMIVAAYTLYVFCAGIVVGAVRSGGRLSAIEQLTMALVAVTWPIALPASMLATGWWFSRVRR